MAQNTLEKNSLLRYFEILKDKFFKIVILNMFFFTYVTVMVLASMGISFLFQNFGINNYFSLFVAFLPFATAGPLIAAITKLCRDFVREVPGFFGDDFKKAFKDNWKQSLLISLIQYFVIMALIIAISFYSGNEGIFYTIGYGVSIFVAIVFLFMSYYVYMMCVTLNLSIKEIIKNSGIFSLLCLLKNLLITLVLAIWIVLFAAVVYTTATSGKAFLWGITIALFMVIFFGFIIYTTAFMTFPQIKKYIVDPYYEEHPEETSKSVNKIASSSIDFNGKQIEKDLPEFVYHNGKMVHRSAIEEENVFDDTPQDK